MSGWIPGHQLVTRYEVTCDEDDSVRTYWSEREARFELAEFRRNEGFGKRYRLTTIRRRQVKRTEVVEDCRLSTETNYVAANGVIACSVLLSSFADGVWFHSRIAGHYATRHQAEADARRWLHDNGYRVRKVPT